jgi:hypothetical protein
MKTRVSDTSSSLDLVYVVYTQLQNGAEGRAEQPGRPLVDTHALDVFIVRVYDNLSNKCAK